MKKVSIVTVNFNQAALTEELLESLSNDHYENIEIIVVDNGSNCNPVPEWTVKYPNVFFIRSEFNLGFAGGNNIGIKKASGDYYFLINNDTEVTEGLIAGLVSVLDRNAEVGIISPKIHFHGQKSIIQYAGFTAMNFLTARNECIGFMEEDTGQYQDAAGPTGYIHGAAMMIRREAVEKAGIMAENYFLYYEEMDWCERIKRSGYSIWVEPNALIYHKESMSVGKKSPLKEFFMNRNRILFIRNNATFFAIFVFYLHFAFLVIPRNCLTYIREGRYDLMKQLFRAIWWNVSHKKDSIDIGYPIKKIK